MVCGSLQSDQPLNRDLWKWNFIQSHLHIMGYRDYFAEVVPLAKVVNSPFQKDVSFTALEG